MATFPWSLVQGPWSNVSEPLRDVGPWTRDLGLASVAETARDAVAVELAIEVQAFERELDCRGDQGRVALRVEGLDRLTHTAHLRRLADVLERWHAFRHLDLEPVLEGLQYVVEAASLEMAVEDVQHRPLHELLDDLV